MNPDAAFSVKVLLITTAIVVVIWLWIKRHRTSAPSQDISSALDLDAPGRNYNLPIVGEANYQSTLQDIARKGRTFTAVLMAEPNNPYDGNAVRVHAQNGKVIGYLSARTLSSTGRRFSKWRSTTRSGPAPRR